MAIIQIRQVQRRDQLAVILNETIPHACIHQCSGTIKLFGRQIRAVAEYVANPFIMDVVCPVSPVQVRQRELHEQVAQWRRI